MQGKEVPDADGQTSDGCLCEEDEGQVQGWISLVREGADDKHVQIADGGVASDERVMMDVFDSTNGDPKSSEVVERAEKSGVRFVSQLDDSRMDQKQPEYRRKLCREHTRWGSTVAGMFASMVPFD